MNEFFEHWQRKISDEGQTLSTLDLSQCNLTATDLAALSPLLTHHDCPKLSKLNLSKNPLGDGMAIIAAILLNNRSIVELDISEMGVGEVGCQEFQKAMRGDVVRLGRLVLSHNPISDNGLEAIIKPINFRCDPALDFPTLECDQCSLSDDAFYALDHITERYDHLRVIFTGNQFSDNGLPQIDHALWHRRHIKYLDLRANPYSDEIIFKILASALPCKLHFLALNNIKLCLPSNYVRNHSVVAAVIPHYSLRLTNMIISPVLLKFLADSPLHETSPQKSHSLGRGKKKEKSPLRWEFKRLSFEKCSFDLEAIKILAFLVQKKPVYTLSFIGCEFPADEKWIALLFAEKFACTRQLVLDLCKIDDHLLEILSSRLQNVTDLHTVSLRSNLLTPRSMSRLQLWLGNEKKCDELILSGNLFENHQFPLNLQPPTKPHNPHPVTPDPTESPPSEIERTVQEIILYSPRSFLGRSTSSPSLKKFLLSPRSPRRSPSKEEPEKVSPKRDSNRSVDGAKASLRFLSPRSKGRSISTSALDDNDKAPDQTDKSSSFEI